MKVKENKALIIFIILTLLNFISIPMKVNATNRLGKNLFSNPGFELGDKNSFSPFIIPMNDMLNLHHVFQKGEIENEIGVDGSKALSIQLIPASSGIIYGEFNVQPQSTYRISADGKKTQEDDNPMHLGVRGFNGKDSEMISDKFNSLQYTNNYIDFTVGDGIEKVDVFIYLPAPKPLLQTSGYIDNFVFEEITYPPTINPLNNAEDITEITGTAEPGRIVEITLPDNTTLSTTVESNGTYSIPVGEKILKPKDTIAAVQYGLYDVKSIATEISISTNRLGKNLFLNQDFESGIGYDPFTITLDPNKKKFIVGEIRSNVGLNSSKALYLQTGGEYDTAYGIFPVYPSSKYRISAYGKLGDKNDNPSYIGVNNNQGPGTFATSPEFTSYTAYQLRSKDFEVGSNINEIQAFIFVEGTGAAKTKANLYLDEFILEEIAYPPEIDPITNGSNATAITGFSEPGTIVSITILREGSQIDTFTTTTRNDGKYSISIDEGTLQKDDVIVAIQTGKDNIKSVQSLLTVLDTIPPKAPTINIVKNTDTIIHGNSEPNSIVIIEFPDESIEEVTTNADGYYQYDKAVSKNLKAGEIIYVKAKDTDDNISETTSTKVIQANDSTTDESKGIGISGKSFILNIGDEPYLSEQKVISLSEANAFLLSDGTDKTDDISVNISLYKDEIGVYPIFLSVEGVYHTIYVSVVDPENTMIDQANDIILYGKDFNVKINEVPDLNIILNSQAKAWKISNGLDLTSSIMVNSDLLNQEAGDHKVTLYINETTHEITISVKADTQIPEISSFEILSPTEHNFFWVNKDIVAKITAIDDSGIDKDTFEISYDNGITWKRNDFHDKTENSAKFTLTKEGNHQDILVRVSDIYQNISNSYKVSSEVDLKIDKTNPNTNYINEKEYAFEELEKIIFSDNLSGIAYAKLDDVNISSNSLVPNSPGFHTLEIADNAGNIIIIEFTVKNPNTIVEMEGIISNDDIELATIERQNGIDISNITPQSCIVLKNIDTGKEYTGFLIYGEKLIFKGIDYGTYEINHINPSDIIFNHSNIQNNSFTLIMNETENKKKILINSKFLILNGFGTILEKDDSSYQP